MALRRRGGSGEAMNPWPGYVDALSTLLMVIIFVLLVFVLAQAFLSVALSGRDRALDRVKRQMAELTDMLSLARGHSSELQLTVAQLNHDLQTANAARDTLAQQLAALRTDNGKLLADRDALAAQRDKLTAQLADSALQLQSAQARAAQMQGQIADAAKRNDSVGQAAALTAAQLADTTRQLAAAQAQAAQLQSQNTQLQAQSADAARQAAAQLADTQAQLAAAKTQLADMQAQAAALDKTVQVDRATIAAKLSDLASMAEQTRALTALRDDLERQARDAAANAMTEQQKNAAVAAQLADEKKLGDSARAQIALLNAQMDQLRSQLASVSAALDISEKADKEKDVQIANLGSRLNAALAQKVEELQRYRSDFFGKLRQVLAGRPGIQVVGDRFIFQSEVLFPVGSADLSEAGAEQITALAGTLLTIAKEIPPDVNWLLRVDGHADKQPVTSSRFASNWELSAARAITVVKLLVAEGVPPDRLAAAAFGDNQPIDNADTPEAYARNRRIELRLTDR
jgi:chemotaxis protein MotB